MAKTFFFLRIFKDFSHLVLMMQQVVVDLRTFLCFYLILIWICGLLLHIIGLTKTL